MVLKKELLVFIISLYFYLVTSYPQDEPSDLKIETLDGGKPFKIFHKLQSVENRTNDDENSKCVPYYEKFFIVLNNSPNRDEILNKIPYGYNYWLNQDLNEGSRGKYIYFAFSKRCYVEPIRDIKVASFGRNPVCEQNNRWEYTPNSEGRPCPGLDLNSGSGGDYLYLYSSKSQYNPIGWYQYPIKDIIFIVANYNSPSWPGYYVYPQDLNAGSGGKYIWIAWQTDK